MKTNTNQQTSPGGLRPPAPRGGAGAPPSAALRLLPPIIPTTQEQTQ